MENTYFFVFFFSFILDNPSLAYCFSGILPLEFATKSVRWSKVKPLFCHKKVTEEAIALPMTFLQALHNCRQSFLFNRFTLWCLLCIVCIEFSSLFKCLHFRFGNSSGPEAEVDPHAAAHASWRQPGLKQQGASAAAGQLLPLYPHGHCDPAHLHPARCLFLNWYPKAGMFKQGLTSLFWVRSCIIWPKKLITLMCWLIVKGTWLCGPEPHDGLMRLKKQPKHFFL